MSWAFLLFLASLFSLYKTWSLCYTKAMTPLKAFCSLLRSVLYSLPILGSAGNYAKGSDNGETTIWRHHSDKIALLKMCVLFLSPTFLESLGNLRRLQTARMDSSTIWKANGLNFTVRSGRLICWTSQYGVKDCFVTFKSMREKVIGEANLKWLIVMQLIVMRLVQFHYWTSIITFLGFSVQPHCFSLEITKDRVWRKNSSRAL